jgi:chromosome segregation ATPase
MVESEFERLGKTVNLAVDRFSKLREERNDLTVRLERSEKMVVDLMRQVEELNHQRDQAKSRLDELISQLEKFDL